MSDETAGAGGPLARATVSQVTLVTTDLPGAVTFYRDVLGAEELYRDDAWAVVRFGPFAVVIVTEHEGDALIAPVELGPESARRALLMIDVDDVDDVAEQLTARGVVLLSGPAQRPWGSRTATFSDPDGHLWEIAQREVRP